MFNNTDFVDLLRKRGFTDEQIQILKEEFEKVCSICGNFMTSGQCYDSPLE